MSQNSSPVKIVLEPSLYEIVAERRARRNAAAIAAGHGPLEDEFPFISREQADAEKAQEESRRASRNASAALPKPTRGLRAAAKAKVAERASSIPDFQRHSRKCQICRSPYLDAIETAYLQWNRADLICRYFHLEDTDTLYRHARASGLDVLRRQNVRFVAESFIESWHGVKITAGTVLRSIRALSCLDDKGHWTDPPRTHIFLRGDAPSPAAPQPELPLPKMERTSLPEQPAAALPTLHAEKIEGDGDLPLSFERGDIYSRRTELSNGPLEPCDRSENRTTVELSPSPEEDRRKGKRAAESARSKAKAPRPCRSLPRTSALHRHKTKTAPDPNRVSMGN